MGNSQSTGGLNTEGKVFQGALSMLPFGPMLAPIFETITAWLGIFQRQPEAVNDTMERIKQAIDEARERQRAEASAEERARQAHERKLAAKEREVNARLREDAALFAAEQADAAARIREEAAAIQAEAAANEAHKHEAAARSREAAAEEAKAVANEARKQEAAAKEREEAALAEVQQANDALWRGISPVVMPTEEQYQTAMMRSQYNAEKLHLAVCGISGSGKSSLINAFRGLLASHKEAAAVGVTETTSEITRYPDVRSDLPYSRFVWYDIPGAGTTAVSDWQYFNDQGLFVFDFIVMVYDVRFSKIDVSIIENCYRFNIPVFIVRSKADQHIDNMIKAQLEAAMESESGEDINHRQFHEQVYEETKAKYVADTKSDFDKHMEKMAENRMFDARDRQMLLNQRVYIVSAANVRSLVLRGSAVDRSNIIDETLLVEDLLSTAARRRYLEAEWKGLFRRGRKAASGAFSSSASRV